MNTLLLTGAGGTVGRLLIDYYLKAQPQLTIIALERSEIAMADLIATYQSMPQVVPILADLLDPQSFQPILQECDAVIHCAALKHVLIGKTFPERQAYENITCFYNLIRAARAAGVKRFLFCSTDKAAQPTGVMGGTKHLLEFVCRDAATPTFATGSVRFANIIGSNGSLLQVIANRIKDGKPIVLRNAHMTRYFLRPDDVTELIDHALRHLKNGEVFIRKTSTARIKDVMEVALEHYHVAADQLTVNTIPTHENIHERLIAPDELGLTHTIGRYLVIGGQEGRPLDQDEQEAALSSSAQTLTKAKVKELIYGP